MKQQVIDSILENKIIAIIRGLKKDELIPTVEAIYKGGVRLVEITYDATGKTSDSETADCIAMLCRHFEGRMYIGAGTVIRTNQVELTKKAGGSFIISPDSFDDVIKKTCELDMVSIPGALTPTEIRSAVRAGADFVKLFPIGNFGVGYVKALTAPLSDVKLLAVGGITEHNIDEYAKCGVCGFGIGGGFIDKKLIQSGDFDGITRLAKKYTEAVKDI